MRRTDTVCSPGVLRRLLTLSDDQALGEDPIPGRTGVGEWRLDPNGQWRFWVGVRAAERAEEAA